MKQLILALLVSMIATAANAAAKDDYIYCSMAGYFYGSGNDFMGGLAAQEAYNRAVMGDVICVAAWKEALQAGQYLSQNGDYRNETDKKISDLAAAFEADVLNFILQGIELK